MSDLFWFTAGFVTLGTGVCWYFARVSEAHRLAAFCEHEARIAREEQKIREDIRAMRDWYNSRRINVEGESEAEIAERLIEMTAGG